MLRNWTTYWMPIPIRKLLAHKAKRLHSIWFFAPAIGWGFLILYFSVMPGEKLPSVMKSVNDKLVHALIYFFSSALIYLGFIRYNLNNPITREALVVTILAGILFGAAVEVLQHYLVNHREGEWMDFLANSTGSIVCVLLFAIFHRAKA